NDRDRGRWYERRGKVRRRVALGEQRMECAADPFLFAARQSLLANAAQQKGPAQWPGLWISCRGIRRSGGLFLDDRILLAGLGGAAARALGEGGFDLLDRLSLGDALHRRDLARQAVEGRFIELALAIGLLRLGVGAIEVTHDLGYLDHVGV